MDNNNPADSIHRKYPKSKHNLQCIGPCYPANKRVIHPVTVEYISDFNNPFCPVDLFVNEDNRVQTLDQCYRPTVTDENMEDVSMKVIEPQLNFNSIHFLRIYYRINSFDEVLVWLENNPNHTQISKQRIVNAGLTGYGSSMTEPPTMLVNFYLSTAKKFWMDKILARLNQYLLVKDGTLSFKKLGKKERGASKRSYLRVEKVNFLVQRLVNFHTVQLFLTDYMNRVENYQDTIDHNEAICTGYVDYLEKQVLKII